MKIYAFIFNPMLEESSYETISLHKTYEGANKALKSHKKEKRKSYNEYVNALDLSGKNYICKFGKWQDWQIKEMEAKEMISSNDIRIGNLLLHKNGQIDRVTFGIIGQFDCSKKYANTIWSPIPLTEEWLVKMGFEGFLGAYYHASISVLFLKKPYVESDTYLVKTNSLDKITSVKYVHQLQNLYFALTGQELTIKL